MSRASQFWQYAELAMLLAYHAKPGGDKRALLDVAHTWAHAALQSEKRRSRAAKWRSAHRLRWKVAL